MSETTNDLALVMGNRFLRINYSCKTGHVTYSIADYAGNVVDRDTYPCGDATQISIEKLRQGYYTLCIIDGDELTKLPFRKTTPEN